MLPVHVPAWAGVFIYKPKTAFAFGMWQYTSTARVPGVSTNVDMSHAYKDYASIIKRAGLGAVKGAEK